MYFILIVIDCRKPWDLEIRKPWNEMWKLKFNLIFKSACQIVQSQFQCAQHLPPGKILRFQTLLKIMWITAFSNCNTLFKTCTFCRIFFRCDYFDDYDLYWDNFFTKLMWFSKRIPGDTGHIYQHDISILPNLSHRLKYH